MTYTYWWTITGVDSDLCGEEFFTELESDSRDDHEAYAETLFPGEDLHCFGRVTEWEAECMGLDTY